MIQGELIVLNGVDPDLLVSGHANYLVQIVQVEVSAPGEADGAIVRGSVGEDGLRENFERDRIDQEQRLVA